MTPHLLYLICSTVRTGSTLLCDLLRQAGAGSPREVFNGTLPYLAHSAEYVARIRENQPGMIWGFKLMFAQLGELILRGPATWAGWEPGAILDAVLTQIAAPRVQFIFTRRHDKVRQAASLVRAQTTGVWHQPTDAAPFSVAALPYDPAQIRSHIAMFERMETAWLAYFAAHHIEPLTLWFEDIVTDLPGTTARACHFLDIPLPEGFAPVSPFHKTAGVAVEALVQRYKAEEGL